MTIKGSQLVAAILNIAAGAAHSTAVDQAIGNAQSPLVGLADRAIGFCNGDVRGAKSTLPLTDEVT